MPLLSERSLLRVLRKGAVREVEKRVWENSKSKIKIKSKEEKTLLSCKKKKKHYLFFLHKLALLCHL